MLNLRIGCRCETAFSWVEFEIPVKIRKINVRKDGICFDSEQGRRSGSFSAWVGYLGRIPKKGEWLKLRVCNWGFKTWNPGWMGEEGGYESNVAYQERGSEILKEV